MLPYIIYEPDESTRTCLFDSIEHCSKQIGAKLSLVIQTSSAKLATEAVSQEKGPIVVLSSIGKSDHGGIKLGNVAMEKNRDNYIVYCLSDTSVLTDVLPHINRPAGFLSLPPDYERLKNILRQIYSDYEALFVNKGTGNILTLQKGSEVYRLPLHCIKYIEAAEKKVIFYTKEQCVGVYDNLNRLADMLEGRFIRCHRSYLINPDYVEYVDFADMIITLTEGISVPLSRSFRGAIRQSLFPAENVDKNSVNICVDE